MNDLQIQMLRVKLESDMASLLADFFLQTGVHCCEIKVFPDWFEVNTFGAACSEEILGQVRVEVHL